MAKLQLLHLNLNQHLQEVDVSKQTQVNGGGSKLSLSNSLTMRENGSHVAITTITGDLPDDVDTGQFNLVVPHKVDIPVEAGFEIVLTNQVITP